MCPPQVGRALVATHDFRRAIEYYESALARGRAGDVSNVEMRSDLIQLYVKLRKFKEVRVRARAHVGCCCVVFWSLRGGLRGWGTPLQAGRLLDEALSTAAASDDVTSLTHARDNLLLLAKVHKGTGNHAEGADVLLRALELQNKIISKLRTSNPGAHRAGVELVALRAPW